MVINVLCRPASKPANVRFYPFNEIRAVAGLRNHADKAAAHDRRIGERANLTDMVGSRNAESQRDGQRRHRAHTLGERLCALSNFVARARDAEA